MIDNIVTESGAGGVSAVILGIIKLHALEDVVHGILTAIGGIIVSVSYYYVRTLIRKRKLKRNKSK